MLDTLRDRVGTPELVPKKVICNGLQPNHLRAFHHYPAIGTPLLGEELWELLQKRYGSNKWAIAPDDSTHCRFAK
jgi:hypothetical protein